MAVDSLFKESFQTLHRAVDRIARQLTLADAGSREYLLEELDALQEIGNRFLESWIDFEDKIQDLRDRFEDTAHSSSLANTGEYLIELNDTEVTVVSDDSNPLLGNHMQADIGQALTTELGERWFRQGIGYFDLLMYKESRLQFEHIVHLDPHMTIARLYLALCLIASGDAKEALRHLHIVEQTARDPAVKAAVHDARAQLFARAGRYKEAMTELGLTLSIRPEYIDAHVNLAVCAYLARDYKEATVHAQNALTLDKKDVTAWRLLGASAHALGYHKEALAAYTRAHQIAPGASGLMIEAGRVCLAARQARLAHNWFSRALYSVHKYEALAGLVEVALLERQYAQAVLLTKKQLCLQPDSPTALLRLGWSLIGSERMDEAERVFTQYEATHGACAYTLTGKARIAVHKDHLEEAHRLLRQVVSDPQSAHRAHGLSEYGRLHLDRGELRLAIRCFQGALALDRKQEDALMGLGAAFREQSRREENADGQVAKKGEKEEKTTQLGKRMN